MAIKDLAFPTLADLKKTCKRNKLIPQPNGIFQRVKCGSCSISTIVYSHSQTTKRCVGCSTVVAEPSGGKVKLVNGSTVRDQK